MIQTEEHIQIDRQALLNALSPNLQKGNNSNSRYGIFEHYSTPMSYCCKIFLNIQILNQQVIQTEEHIQIDRQTLLNALSSNLQKGNNSNSRHGIFKHNYFYID